MGNIPSSGASSISNSSAPREKSYRFRILVIGRANAGKTTLLKRVCGTDEDPCVYDEENQNLLEPTAERGIHDIRRAFGFKSNPGFIFHDSPGFEAGSDREIKEVQSFIAERAKATNVEDQLHAIWFCFTPNLSLPLLQLEHRFFNEARDGNVPVVAIFMKFDDLITQVYKPGLGAKKNRRSAEHELQVRFRVPLSQSKFPPGAYVRLEDMHNDDGNHQDQVKELMEETDKLVSTHQNNLDLSFRAAVGTVNAASVIERGTTQENNKMFSQPTVFDYLVKLQSEVEIFGDALTPLEGDIAHLLHTRILSSKGSYKALLEAKGSKAQTVLDLLQSLLNSPHVVDQRARKSILTALLRLSTSSGLYPQQLWLPNVERDSLPLAQGQYGDIYKGEYQGRPVCLKIFKLYQSEVNDLLKRCSREVIIWSQLKHPNLLPFYGISNLDDPNGRVGLVSPWMKNGNLSSFLNVNSKSRRLPLVHDIMAGLQYLHHNQVVHGDLKGLNILIKADGSACLADFGLSSVIDNDAVRWASLGTLTRPGGTVRWMAPEMINPEDDTSRPTPESDIYSLASVMYEAFTGQVPYYEILRDFMIQSKIIGGVKPSRPSQEAAPELTDVIWEIMMKCWSQTPGDRLTIDEVKTIFPVQTS